MKKIIVLALLMLAVMSITVGQEYNIYSYNNNELVTNENFIDSEFLFKNINDSDFLVQSTLSTNSPENEVVLSRAKPYIGVDPGDFERIEINNNSTNFVYKNANSWSKFEDELYSYSNQGWYVEISINSESKALIFKGVQYSSGLPELTIILLHGNKIDVVYNKQMRILSIQKSANVFSMQTQSNNRETIDGVNWTPAITHTIWLEDGVLKFKDNN